MTQEAEDGWIEWSGGECPVGPSARGYVRLRIPLAVDDYEEDYAPYSLDHWRWAHDGGAGDIIAYRVVKP